MSKRASGRARRPGFESGRDDARNAEQDMEARNHGHKARLRSNNVFRFADAGSFSCIGRGSSRSCLRGLVLPEQKGFEHQLFLELRRMEEKRGAFQKVVLKRSAGVKIAESFGGKERAQ